MNTDQEFINSVYKEICQCYNSCIKFDNIDIFTKPIEILNNGLCTQITVNNNDSIDFYNKLIYNAIQYFINNKIIFKNNKYYITNEKILLTWENIKTLDTKYQILFWLFRKLIVDCILKTLLISKPNLTIFSVGSTNLSSDYDITIYGNTQDKHDLMEQFQIEFKRIFNEHSSKVFDTNIYGKAFIDFTEHPNYIKHSCNTTFYYLKNNDSLESQLVWGLVKFFKDFRQSFGEKMYNDYVSYLVLNIKLPHIEIARKTFIYLNNTDPDKTNYIGLFELENYILDKYNNKIQGFNDYTSLINFFGEETYFSRGAFLDTVVNDQMCQQKNTIPLNESEFISSILENAGFFFLHNTKTKYVLRIYNTLIRLSKYNPNYTFVNTNSYKYFTNLISLLNDGNNNYDTKYCKWIDYKQDIEDVNLLKCEKYSLFSTIIKLIYHILTDYNKFYTNSEPFTFFNEFVSKNTDLGSHYSSPIKSSPISDTSSDTSS